MKIAASMIVAGHEAIEDVNRCLDSVVPYVDKVFITVTTPEKNGLIEGISRDKVEIDYEPEKFFKEATKQDIKWLKKYLGSEPTVKVGDRVFQYDQARNHSLEKTKDYEWFLWIDADDVLRGGENITKVIEDSEKLGVESVFCNYIYHPDIRDGKLIGVIIEHLRERICKNNGVYKWVAPIHETLIEQRPTRKEETKLVDVLHLSTPQRRELALNRNVKTLELSIRETNGADPRPVYYLGKAYFDIALHLQQPDYFKRAGKLFNNYLFGTEEHQNNNRSGWQEERSQCWEYLMEIHRQMDNHDKSIWCGMNALIEDDKFPSIYLNIALSMLLKGFYERAIHWVKIAATIQQPQSTLVNNPRDQQARALEILYNSYLNLNRLDEAWKSAKKLYDMLPDNPAMKERFEFVDNIRNQRDLTKTVVQLADHITKHDDKNKLKALMMALPSNIASNPIIADVFRQAIPPRTWEKDEIGIFCGPGFTQWSPKTLENPEGNFLGGSEEAVVYLSKELAKKGWKVTVFCDPGADAGEYEGVNYVPYYTFNQQDIFNVLVSWRRPDFFDNEIMARYKAVWAHDIQNPLHYTEERLKKIDKIIVLSPWHRSNLPKVPDDKILVSSNGVDL